MKSYKLSYLDENQNELDNTTIKALNIGEARKHRDRLFAECMLYGCTKIKVSRIY